MTSAEVTKSVCSSPPDAGRRVDGSERARQRGRRDRRGHHALIGTQMRVEASADRAGGDVDGLVVGVGEPEWPGRRLTDGRRWIGAASTDQQQRCGECGKYPPCVVRAPVASPSRGPTCGGSGRDPALIHHIRRVPSSERSVSPRLGRGPWRGIVRGPGSRSPDAPCAPAPPRGDLDALVGGAELHRAFEVELHRLARVSMTSADDCRMLVSFFSRHTLMSRSRRAG